MSQSQAPAEFSPWLHDRDSLYDKLLGTLVASALGDAMGAPTEMWSREQIQIEYGFVEGLDSMVREPSGEGIWDFNLPAGSTTDDTRWKALMVDYFTGTAPETRPVPKALSATGFSEHIQQRYLGHISALQATEGSQLEPYEAELRKAQWLKEWAQVSEPYLQGDIEAYSEALHRFYGGEMVCAGMLFTPMVGAIYPETAAYAYEQAYAIDLFDLGYAKDISGLTAAMVSAAMSPGASPDSILKVLRNVDPKGYFKSRLVGRTAYKIYQSSQAIVHQARQVEVKEFFTAERPLRLALPLETEADSIRYAQLATAYQALDEELMRYPFHPAEIHLINLTALQFADFDLLGTLRFVINYGRDNDTVAAVSGAILGAYWGAKHLPPELLKKVLKANRALGMDLEQMAQRLTEAMLGPLP